VMREAATELATEVRVGYQGEPGAFSEEAVWGVFPGAIPVPHRGLRSIFDDVAAGSIRYGVVPVENSQAGSINETFDLLWEGRVSIVGEVVVHVDHALLALPGSRLADIRLVSSHPQALAQCEEFLGTLDLEIVPVYDTAGAAKRIAEEHVLGEAAVASPRAAELYGLDVLARHIQTHRENRTRFAAICANPTPLGPADKTSILFGVRNEPGALYRALGVLAARELNLSKIESRPLGSEPWQYRFYLDVDAGMHEPELREALEDMHQAVTFIRVLGSYPRWPEDPAHEMPRPGRSQA
jgi:prephenate dehydratase